MSSVLAQPCSIPFVTHSGRNETYTPDYLVTYAVADIAAGWEPSPLLVEVKSKEDWKLNWREWSPKWKAARRYAAEQGWRFKVMDETRIRTMSLDNIHFLMEYRDRDVPREESDVIVDDVRSLGIAKIDYVLAKHFPGLYRAEGVAHLWHLIATRRLDCDIGELLGDATEVWVPNGR
ncbi:TnsA endonuclease N-terminal domain-containing protein [Acidovorax sp. A1169]|uniref:TnsA endonuclease N-terminal domain-containing protein n=1 Tax=Acidovorax sp. A1169 TaxID=3059524 RepID=UPI002737F2DA|nr:TnsA endonuclease N-terminal domain-containing protein [Acidovorax sp. A1169]MDP4078523.1 TnsA endonuclease N-terminal domain-containing protein [Acidovorax sp. A1169]